MKLSCSCHELSVKKSFVNLAFFLSLLILPAARTFAAEVTVSWERMPDPSVIGYYVYWGENPRPAGCQPYSGISCYSHDNKAEGGVAQVPEGRSPQYTIGNLSAGVTYYIALTAYNEWGESDFSGEMSYTASGGATSVRAPTNLRVIKP